MSRGKAAAALKPHWERYKRQVKMVEKILNESRLGKEVTAKRIVRAVEKDWQNYNRQYMQKKGW